MSSGVREANMLENEDLTPEEEEARAKKEEQERAEKELARNRALRAPLYLYCSGSGASGELGLGSGIKYTPQPEQVQFAGRFTFAGVCCSETFTIILKEIGDMYTWGTCSHGELGRGELKERSDEPKRIDSMVGKVVMKISAGKDHCACILDNGRIYTWGNGNMYKLGHGDKKSYSTPQLLQSVGIGNRKVVSIACGADHTACVVELQNSVHTEVYTWGCGKVGALGLGNLLDAHVPERVKTLDGLQSKAIYCGANHTAVVTMHGKLFTWGLGDDGRLGHGDVNQEDLPRLVEFFDKQNVAVEQIACGTSHMLACTSDGKLYSWGLGHLGQLGHGTTDSKARPKELEALAGKKVIFVAAGSWHSAVITDAGSRTFLYMWGLGEQGQLGINEAVPTTKTFPYIVDHMVGRDPLLVACGIDRSMVVSSHTTVALGFKRSAALAELTADRQAFLDGEFKKKEAQREKRRELINKYKEKMAQERERKKQEEIERQMETSRLRQEYLERGRKQRQARKEERLRELMGAEADEAQSGPEADPEESPHAKLRLPPLRMGTTNRQDVTANRSGNVGSPKPKPLTTIPRPQSTEQIMSESPLHSYLVSPSALLYQAANGLTPSPSNKRFTPVVPMSSSKSIRARQLMLPGGLTGGPLTDRPVRRKRRTKKSGSMTERGSRVSKGTEGKDSALIMAAEDAVPRKPEGKPRKGGRRRKARSPKKRGKRDLGEHPIGDDERARLAELLLEDDLINLGT